MHVCLRRRTRKKTKREKSKKVYGVAVNGKGRKKKKGSRFLMSPAPDRLEMTIVNAGTEPLLRSLLTNLLRIFVVSGPQTWTSPPVHLGSNISDKAGGGGGRGGEGRSVR